MKYSLFIVVLFFSIDLFSQEIVEFRGINRTGHFNETGLLKEWPKSGRIMVLKWFWKLKESAKAILILWL